MRRSHAPLLFRLLIADPSASRTCTNSPNEVWSSPATV
ncbi:hypothetical protein FHR80_004193 [Cellulomonas cellasea]|uniref:Uncharacterized protein n=1 Tax=Cellulomonas cellasea TaxID=43670 RepID=A0A7W4YCY6_9CELL|nr:hypothetical protein [Cellulomonas cellasea]